MKISLPVFFLVCCAFFSCTKQPLSVPQIKALKQTASHSQSVTVAGEHPLVLVKNKTSIKVYLRTGLNHDRWIQLNLRHDSLDKQTAVPITSAPSNYNIWHFRQCSEAYRSSPTSFVFAADTNQLCESGEWEFAIQPTGSIFSGGSVHGSEWDYYFTLKADGVFIKQGSSYQKECDEIQLVQSSYVYEYNKYLSFDRILKLTKTYTFTAETVLLKYEVTFLKDENVTALKFGMFPGSRYNESNQLVTGWGTRTVNGVVSPVVNISTQSFAPSGIIEAGNPNTNKISIWGDDFAASVETERSAIFPNSKMVILETYTYNKIYPDFIGSVGSVFIPNGQVYTMTAKYNLSFKL
jgi:hypothetical protein